MDPSLFGLGTAAIVDWVIFNAHKIIWFELIKIFSRVFKVKYFDFVMT